MVSNNRTASLNIELTWGFPEFKAELGHIFIAADEKKAALWNKYLLDATFTRKVTDLTHMSLQRLKQGELINCGIISAYIELLSDVTTVYKVMKPYFGSGLLNRTKDGWSIAKRQFPRSEVNATKAL